MVKRLFGRGLGGRLDQSQDLLEAGKALGWAWNSPRSLR